MRRAPWAGLFRPLRGEDKTNDIEPDQDREPIEQHHEPRSPQPILNSSFEIPARHWFMREGETPKLREARRPAIVYPPREEQKDRRVPWNLNNGTLAPSNEYAPGLELTLVNLVRERVAVWRN